MKRTGSTSEILLASNTQMPRMLVQICIFLGGTKQTLPSKTAVYLHAGKNTSVSEDDFLMCWINEAASEIVLFDWTPNVMLLLLPNSGYIHTT